MDFFINLFDLRLLYFKEACVYEDQWILRRSEHNAL